MALSLHHLEAASTSMSQVGACVNCFAYDWHCDLSSLRQCSRCKGMTYCSEICQLEHYNKVHRKHCKYMAGIKVKEKSIHTMKNCLRCSVRGKMRAGELSNPASTVWPCIFEDLWFPDIEPFPKLKNKQTGKMQIMFKQHGYLLPVDLGEVSGKFTGFHEHLLSTITHICLKLTFINPECKERMDKVIKDLCNVRFSCWRIFFASASSSLVGWISSGARFVRHALCSRSYPEDFK